MHNYDDPQNPTYRGVQKNQDVQVLDQETKWWKVKHGKFVGYASRYYFAAKNVKNSYESEEWRQSGDCYVKNILLHKETPHLSINNVSTFMQLSIMNLSI